MYPFSYTTPLYGLSGHITLRVLGRGKVIDYESLPSGHTRPVHVLGGAIINNNEHSDQRNPAIVNCQPSRQQCPACGNYVDHRKSLFKPGFRSWRLTRYVPRSYDFDPESPDNDGSMDQNRQTTAAVVHSDTQETQF